METVRLGKFAPLWRRALMGAWKGRYLRRNVKSEFGDFPIYVSPGSQLSVLAPGGKLVEPMHARFIRNWVEEGAVVWDIGANVGLFALPAALKSRSGIVYAFEPDIETILKLYRSSRIRPNRKLNISVCSCAVSDKDGISEFLISSFSRSMNKLRGAAEWHSELYEVQESRLIPTLRIDALMGSLKKPDIVKIDVEGAEMLVLRGGHQTIGIARPVMLIEAPRQIWPELAQYLADLDYAILDGQSDDLVPLSEPVWDTVAVPREKLLAKQRGSSASR